MSLDNTTKIDNKKPSVMIATPMYGGMCTGRFMIGVLQTVLKLQSLGIQVYFSEKSNESLITRARNELAHNFLEQDLDYLMFIDADIGFDADAVYTLLKANKDIACGIYPKKEIDWNAVERAVAKGETTNLKDYSGAFVLNAVNEKGGMVPVDETGCVEVRHGGTGFMLINKNVFHKLADKVPSYRISTIKDANDNYVTPEIKEFFSTSIDDSGCLLSEDYHFCEIWRKNGGKIYINPFIKLEHIGAYHFSGDFIQAGANLK